MKRKISDLYLTEQELYQNYKHQIGVWKAREYIKSVFHLEDFTGLMLQLAIADRAINIIKDNILK